MSGLFIILGIVIPVILTLIIGYVIMYKFMVKVIGQLNTLSEQNNTDIIPGRPMSYEECTNVIDTVIKEIYVNKYQLYYTLKEIKIIPDMDKEIESMAKEVLSAFSETQYREFSRYYTNTYLAQYITRNIQLLFIEYTDKNKPNVG